MEKIRVLVVTTTDIGFNGITSVIMNYYRNIDRSKIQFDFAIGEKIHDTIENEIKELGGQVFKMPSRKKNTVKYIKVLKKLAKEKKYKIAHVHGNSGTLYLDIYALRKAGVRIRISHSHNSTCKHKLIHKLLKSPLNKEATHAIACSKLAGDWIYEKEYMIINNGINVEDFLYNETIRNEYRKKMNIENKFVIGHIGHFSYQKNHQFLINIFKEVHEKDSSAMLMLIGDGKFRTKIEKQIADLGIKENVILLGRREDTQALIHAMDVFVFPSRFEGLPVVLIEAQAAGLKCIVSDVITRECKVTDRLEYLSLNDIDKWKYSILNSKKTYKRDNVEQIMINSNYNIKNETKKLEKIYLEC